MPDWVLMLTHAVRANGLTVGTTSIKKHEGTK